MKQSSLRKRVNIDRYTFEEMSRFLDSGKNAPFAVPRERAGRYLSCYSKIRKSLFFENFLCSCEVDICRFCVLDLVVSGYLESSQISQCRGPFVRIIMLG